MIKHHEYKGVIFLIRVELNTSAERHLEGKILHTVKSIANEGQFYFMENCESKNLQKTIDNLIAESKKYIDSTPILSVEEQMLFSLGFEEE